MDSIDNSMSRAEKLSSESYDSPSLLCVAYFLVMFI